MALVLSGIGVTYGAVVALDDVSLSVPDRAIVGVIGPNGAGKTTLFNVVCGVVPPRTGTMTRDGEPFHPRPHQLIALGIARTLQGGGLFDSMTVLENAMAGARPPARTGLGRALLGLRRAAGEERDVRERARTVLDEVGLGRYARDRPPTLPQALRRKVALARALVSQPRLLLLDEPAGGLSAEEADELGALIAGLPRRRGCSVLLVEHRVDVVMRVCQEIVVLDLGRVIARGTPDQIRDDPAVTAAYFGTD